MIGTHFLHGDELHGGVVIGKIIGHGLNSVLDGCLVGTLLGHHIAITGVLFPGSQIGGLAAANPIHGLRHRNRVLPAVQNAGNPANRVGMALADALAPEGIVLALGQDGGGIQPVHREQTRIPAHRDERNVTAFGCRPIHRREMGRNRRMGIERVNHVEVTGNSRGHLGQIRGAAAAENHYINLILPCRHVLQGQNRHVRGHNLHSGRIPAGENRSQSHIRILADGALHAPGQVAVTNDSDIYHRIHILIKRCLIGLCVLRGRIKHPGPRHAYGRAWWPRARAPW